MAYYIKPRRPPNASPGWYKAFADGIQDHYNKDYIEVCAVYNYLGIFVEYER